MADDKRSGRQKVGCRAQLARGASRSPPPTSHDLTRVWSQAPNKMRDGFLAVSDAPAQWEDKSQVMTAAPPCACHSPRCCPAPKLLTLVCAQAHNFKDVCYHTCAEGIAKITINRPAVHNAFRPLTTQVRGEQCTTLSMRQFVPS